MQYYVIWADGQKFGPATIDVLNQWITENRIQPSTPIETLDGQRITAGEVPGLNFPSTAAAASVATPTPAAAPTPTPQPIINPVANPNPTAVPNARTQYHVLGPDGTPYGPADVPTLNQWVVQNRLTPTTQLKNVETGQVLPASAVAGINFPSAQPIQPTMAPGSAYGQSAYSMAPGPSSMIDPMAQQDFNRSLIFSIIGFFCCPFVFTSIGLYYGLRAKNAGHPNGTTAVVVSSIILGLAVLGFIFWIILFVIGAASGATPR
jgi:hypothetical protein